MIYDLEKLTIKSRNPLYYYDTDNEAIGHIVNEYNDGEYIELEHYDFNSYKIPIVGNYIIIPEKGIILFKSQNDAIRLTSMLTNHGNIFTICHTAFQSMKHDNNFIKKMTKKYPIDFEDGLYSFENLDECVDENLMELRYLNHNNDIRKVHQIESENLKNYIDDFLLMSLFSSKNDFKHERFVFEIKIEGNYVYVAGYAIGSTKEIVGPMYFTAINNYPIFTSKFQAGDFRYVAEKNNRNNIQQLAVNIAESQYRQYTTKMKQYKDDLLVSKVNMWCNTINSNIVPLVNNEFVGGKIKTKFKDFKNNKNKKKLSQLKTEIGDHEINIVNITNDELIEL